LLNNKNEISINLGLITKKILVISFVFVNFSLFSQATNQFDAIKLKADSLVEIEAFDQALDLYRESLVVSRLDSNWRNYFYTIKELCGLSRISKKYQYLIDSTNFYVSNVPPDKLSIRAAIYDNVARALNVLNQPYPASKFYEQAITIKEKSLDTTNARSLASIMYMFHNLSISYSNIGDQESAIQTVNNAIKYAAERNHDKLCTYILDKGKFYFHNNQNKQAKDQYHLVLDKCKDNIGVYHFLSEIYLQEDSLAQAKYFLDKANDILVENDIHYIHNTLMSKYYEKIGERVKARELLYPLFENNYKFSNQRVEVKEMVKYAQLLNRSELYDESLFYSHKAISKHFNLDTANVLARPIIDNSVPDVWIIEALLLKADYFFKQYNLKEDTDNLIEAEFYYDLVFSYFDEFKSNIQTNTSKYRISGYTQDIYAKLIRFNIDLFKETKNKDNFFKAFSLIQSSSAFVLKNSVSERKAFEILGVEKDTVEKYLYYKNRISNPESLSQDDLESTEFIEFKEFQRNLFSRFPSLDNYYTNEVIDIENIQNNIDNNAMVIQYYFYNDKLYSLQISKSTIDILEHNIDENFELKVNNYVELITDVDQWDASRFATESYNMYKILLEDILKKPSFNNIEQLVIIPDGPIKKIAFNSFVDKFGIKYPTVEDYLISNYEVSYLYYASQLIEGDISNNEKNGFVGFGIEYNDDEIDKIIGDYQSQVRSTDINDFLNLKVLKYAAEEVLNIAEITGGSAFTNQEVTYSKLIELINDYRIIHISAHAFLNDENYNDSYIALTQNAHEKYKFSYHDILNMNLENELVVLSACQTNAGNIIAGEGLMSLSRAFVQSGSKAVMGAYWDSSDKITKDIMELFYKNLNQGYSKSKSLQLAQIEFLSNDDISSPTFRLPFYWSAWALYGNNSQIINEPNIFILVTLIGIIALGLFYFLRKRKMQFLS